MSTQASRFNLTDDELTRAAQELATAVGEYLEATKTGKGRRTASGFVDVVRGSLGRQRCSKGLFALVVERAVELGLVERSTSEAGRTYLVPVQEPVETSPEQVESDTPTVVVLPTSAKAGKPPVEDYPSDHKCPHCGSEATLCASCQEPAWEDDLYVDSKGRWRCSSCNNIHFSESWGGFHRWKRPHAPKGEE